MFTNYLKIAWRNIIRSKGYSVLNILGLGIGMAVALLIGLWVNYQYSFDKFLPNHSRLYQVRRDFNANGDILNFTTTSLKLGDALRSGFPEFEYIAESDGGLNHGLMAGNKKIQQSGNHVNAAFLEMFPFAMVKGNAATAMKDAYSIVLTESTAKALFGDQDPMNKYVRLDDQDNLKVTGVIKDLPANSTQKFSYLIPFAHIEQTQNYVKQSRTDFSFNSFETFAELKPGVSFAQVAEKIRNVEKSATANPNAMNSEVVLQPMDHWHLWGNYKNRKELGGFLDYVQMFTLIGALVLLIACINFINLTTARSEKRAREVGVRKAIGSLRKNLIFQFLTESFLLTFFSFLLALLLTSLLLPAFNALAKSQVEIPLRNPQFWLVTMTGVILTAFLAGSRPAFYLSSFNPVEVLKGRKLSGRAGALSRKFLVVAQFSCSIALIISTIIVYQQISYAQNRPTGYNTSRLMMTDIMNSNLSHSYRAMKNEMIEQGVATSVSQATSTSTDIGWHTDIGFPGKKAGETIEMGAVIVADDYFKTMGMQILAGRDFTGVYDSNSVIFNETAVQQMRLKQPLGQVVNFQGREMRIAGVVRDALMISPFSPADPTIFATNADQQFFLLYRLAPSISARDAVGKLTTIYNKYNPNAAFTYAFSDEEYARKFDTELLVGRLSSVFAALAIFISCLGLFGLAAYVAEQRTKEIGIRKVLGASVPQVWLLLSRDFVLLVLLSCIIASGMAAYFLQDWLQQYAYRIHLTAGVFLMAAVVAVLLTLFTISFQALKAGFTNPVKSLRSE